MTVRARHAALAAVAALAVAGPPAVGDAAAAEAPEAQWRVLGVAGNGSSGPTRAGIHATDTPVAATDVAALAGGGFLFADARRRRVFEVQRSGLVTLVAGSGSTAVSGDGGPAATAGLGALGPIAALPGGGFVLADGVFAPASARTVHTRLRRVAPNGTITTIAGAGTGGFAGDGGPGPSARFGDIVALSATADGAILALDAGAGNPSNQRVRRIGPDGIVTTVAGNGTAGFSGDGGLATAAAFQDPTDVAAVADGGFLVADALNHRVRRVWPDGLVTTVAGAGPSGPAEDGLPATQTQLDGPVSVEPAADGGFWIADRLRLRRVGADGVIRLVTSAADCRHDDIAGPGTGIFAGDGQRARCAAIAASALASTDDGGLLVADRNGRARIVEPGATPLAAVAITSTRIGGDAVQVNFFGTVAGAVHAELARGHVLAATAAATTPGGWGAIVLPRPRGSGALRLRLVVSSSDGDAAVSEVAIQLGTLGPITARRALEHFFADTSGEPAQYGPCRRFSTGRVDCERIYTPPVGFPVCSSVHSVRVLGSGLAAFRAYDCPRQGGQPFRRHPRFNTAEWPQRWPPMIRLGLIPAPLLPLFS
jgi:hypothetical protein